MEASSPLIAILKDELLVQRVFLSSDEERALDRESDGADDGDLAYERVKARRYLFYAALRDRFIYDGRRRTSGLTGSTRPNARLAGLPRS